MLKMYDYPEFPYRRSQDQDRETPIRRPVIIVGGGPVGLSMALDLSVHGVPVVVLNQGKTVSVGSRAVCYAKRALEIWDRLGCAKPMIDKGVVWKIGKVFRDTKKIYEFDLLPESDHKMPAFINLQQYYLEEYLVERAKDFPTLDLRWRHQCIATHDEGDHVLVRVETEEGVYDMECDWLIAADGARSHVRRSMGLEFVGQEFKDRFLIADVVMKAGFPPERWFWFNPPFHRNQSTLLHMQADDVWRIDFQLGWDADPEEEKKPENVIPRLSKMLGEDTEFELEWVSVYTFQCRRLDRFRHNRVLFVGDAAHQVSPFGARGANSGVQDADNLTWKLELVLDGTAPERLLDSYSDERVYAAEENILNSTRSTDFITPKSPVSKAFRDAVLDLAEDYPFARRLLNSGRLSTPATYADSVLNTPDADDFSGRMAPGAPCLDAPVGVAGEDGWLLNQLGNRFVGLHFAENGAVPAATAKAFEALARGDVPIEVLSVGVDFEDVKGLVAERYDARPGTFYLIRPDQHVAARLRTVDAAAITAARDRAIGK